MKRTSYFSLKSGQLFSDRTSTFIPRQISDRLHQQGVDYWVADNEDTVSIWCRFVVLRKVYLAPQPHILLIYCLSLHKLHRFQPIYRTIACTRLPQSIITTELQNYLTPILDTISSSLLSRSAGSTLKSIIRPCLETTSDIQAWTWSL